MSSSFQPKTNPEEATEPSSPTTATVPATSTAPSGNTIVEPRRPSRWADPAFGDRLANARNLPPVQAPPPPPPTMARSFADGHDGGLQVASSSPNLSGRTGVTPTFIAPNMAFAHDKETQRWPREKGSYRNPYDYPITSGRALGAHDLPRAALRGSVPELTAREPNLLQQAMRGHIVRAARPSGVPEPDPTDSKNRFVLPPPDAQNRILLLGPLSLMRKESDKIPELKPLASFIDKHMAVQLHTVVERDFVIPAIVYMVSIPMTEEHWTLYNRVLVHFKFPLAFHEMLAHGKQNFDHIAGSTDPALPPTMQEANNMLTYGTASGMDLQAILRELVKANFHE